MSLSYWRDDNGDPEYVADGLDALHGGWQLLLVVTLAVVMGGSFGVAVAIEMGGGFPDLLFWR